MSYINNKIRDCFPEAALMKNNANNALFGGRNLPSFVKDYIIRKFSNEEGVIDKDRLLSYLCSKIPDNTNTLKARLLSGEEINITTRFIVKSDIALGKTTFTIPDAQIDSNAYIDSNLVEENQDTLVDGEIWGNVTLKYVEPQGKKKGYVNMISFKSFQPYKIKLEYFREVRKEFSTEEWIDFLVASMEYNPDNCTQEQKIELICRLLTLVQPRLNLMELGPKGTGKSYFFNNFSKHAWIVSGGKTSRAKMFYNKSSRQFGLMKNFDTVAIDEISTFGFVDPDEMQSIFKSYLEAGTATVDNVKFMSECSLVLMGNLPLDKNKTPVSDDYYRVLPEMFHESATLDRFHSFIEGWKLPRLEAGSILQGWTIDVEYLSSVFHQLRICSEYEAFFNQIVKYDDNCDLRDLKAICRVASAYHKILFPHITSLSDIEEDFLSEYKKFCIEPAIKGRQIIRKQCHKIDKEFKEEVSLLDIKIGDN